MEGKRMKLANEALELFIKSLPVDSKFNVIGFGSKYDWMNETSVKYSQKIADKTIEEVRKFDADLEYTEVYHPLEVIFSNESDPKYPRNVFLLTDGDADDTNKALK
jgi:hypothetical protein